MRPVVDAVMPAALTEPVDAVITPVVSWLEPEITKAGVPPVEAVTEIAPTVCAPAAPVPVVEIVTVSKSVEVRP